MHPGNNNGPDQLEQLLCCKTHPLEIRGQDVSYVGCPGPQETKPFCTGEGLVQSLTQCLGEPVYNPCVQDLPVS